MQIIDEGEGPKIAFTTLGAALNFGALSVDLAAEQTDVERRIIVWRKADGALSLDGGERYAALIVIPTLALTETEAEIDGEPSIVIEVAPLDLAAVALHLWPLED